MVIRLDENYNAMTSTALLGYVGETNARPVSVEGLTVDGADRYVMMIDYGDGTAYEVDITGGQWTPTADILRSAQTVSCQIAAKKLAGDEYILVKKSRIFRLRIGAAIGDNAVPSPDVAMDALDKIDAIGRQAHADMQTAQSAAETATTAAENAKKSATNAGLSADTATQAASRAETAKTAAETSATQAETAMQGAETARQQAVTAQNAAKISADLAASAAQQTTADKTATAGYAQTAKTNADSTAADRQAVQTLAEQVTADKTTVAENAAQVAEDRTAAETAAQTAQAVADSLPEDYVTAVGKIAENTTEINNTNTEVSELKGDLTEISDKHEKDLNEIVETKIGRNLFDTSKVTNDCIFGSTGAIATGMSAYCISDFIDVQGGEKVSINYGYQFAWFDENKNFLQFASDRSTSYSVIVAPSNARYIRISIAKSELNYAMIVKTDENIPLQPSDYEPYKLERIVRKNVLPKIEKEDLPHIDYPEKIMDKFRYLMFTFAGALNKPDNLIILGSNDGETFDIVKKTGTYTCKNTYHDTKNDRIAVNGLRDPSVIKIGQWYYITYTVIGWNRGSEIGMCRTKDFEEYEELDNLYLTNENGNEFTRVWAPAWLQDEHNIYLCVGCEYDSAFRMYLMDYDFITHTITAKHNTGIGSNDYHFYYENGMYYALANDYAMKSNDLFGGYTRIRTAIDGGKIEGDIAIRTDDGKYRVYVALINGYSDTDGIGMYELDSLSATTRPAIRPITLTDEARAYQTELGYLYTHPSIYDFNDETIIRGDISNILKRLDALEK